MTKMKTIQKVKFLGQPKQTYSIGRFLFPHNVWKEVTPEQLRHIIGDCKIRILFDFEPPINFSQLNAEPKAVKKPKKKKKEDN